MRALRNENQSPLSYLATLVVAWSEFVLRTTTVVQVNGRHFRLHYDSEGHPVSSPSDLQMVRLNASLGIWGLGTMLVILCSRTKLRQASASPATLLSVDGQTFFTD